MSPSLPYAPTPDTAPGQKSFPPLRALCHLFVAFPTVYPPDLILLGTI